MPAILATSKEPLSKQWDHKAQRKGVRRNFYTVVGDVYYGEWLNNEKHGKGTYTWKETSAVYTGDWKKGKRSGLGTLTCVDDNKNTRKEYCGGWKSDLKHGYGTEFYPNKEFYEGEWFAGKRCGWGRMYYKDGTIYEGEWSGGERNGQGMIRLNSENRYEGTWKDDQKNGHGKFYYQDSGQVFEGVWKNNIPRYGVMRDFGRDNASDPTPYPIPKIELKDIDTVMESARHHLEGSGDHDLS